MFILRRISSHGVQMNKVIGEGYTYIGRAENPEDFRTNFEAVFEKKHVADGDETSDDDTKNCYGFICNSSIIQPLYKHQKNFMMTDSGQTFAKL